MNMIQFEKLFKHLWVSFITLTVAKRNSFMPKNYQNKKIHMVLKIPNPIFTPIQIGGIKQLYLEYLEQIVSMIILCRVQGP